MDMLETLTRCSLFGGKPGVDEGDPIVPLLLESLARQVAAATATGGATG